MGHQREKGSTNVIIKNLIVRISKKYMVICTKIEYIVKVQSENNYRNL